MITFIETVKKVLQDVLITPGQILHAIDTNETFFDTQEGNRIRLNNVIYLNNESDKELISPLENVIYIIKETSQPYKHDGAWFKIKDCDSLLCTLYHNDKYIPTTLTKKDKKLAPRTLASVVYNEAGEGISVEIESANTLTLCKTKATYVEATENNQRVFKIPFPMSNYNFTKNFMTVIINNTIVNMSDYVIRDTDYLVLNNDQPGVDAGQLVLFIFYYNVYIDINDGLVIQTKNLADRVVTENKLASDSVSTRTVIDKNINNRKLADDAVDSRVIARKSISTEHLSDNLKINADNILETDNRKFVSQTQINNWNNSITTVEQLKIKSQIHVSDTEPTVGVKNKDIWADTTNFIFKVRKDNSWIPMGAVYK